MPRVTVPVTAVTRAGVAPATEVNGDATNQHQVANNGRVALLVRNAHATLPRNLTIRFGRTVDGQAVASRVVAVPAVSSRYVGPFPVSNYGSTLQIDVETSDLKLTAYTLG